MKPGLSVYTIFDAPREAPDFIVVRPFHAQPDGSILPDQNAVGFRIEGDKALALQRARAFCAQRGLSRIDRHPSDDPTIVETWL